MKRKFIVVLVIVGIIFSGVSVDFVKCDNGVDLEYVIEMNEMDPYCPEVEWTNIELKISNNNEEKLYFVFGVKHNSEWNRNFTTDMVKKWNAVLRVRAFSGNQKLNIYFDDSEKTFNFLKKCGWEEYGGEGAFLLSNASQELTINYQVNFDNQKFFMFMVPINVSINSIKLKFNLPDDWINTPLSKQGDYYVVSDYPKSILETLTETSFGFYPAEYYSKTVGDTEVVLAARKYQGKSKAEQKKRLEMYSKFFEYFVDLYGSYKYDKYLIIDSGTEIGFRELYSGFSYERKFCNDPEIFLLLSSIGFFKLSYFHEWLHTWNYDILGPDEYPWLHDGMAEYFVARGPKDVFGLENVYKAYLYFNWEWYKKRMNTNLDIPLWDVPHGMGITSGHWMIYAKGALFFYMLNEKIKEITNNEKDLIDVMKYMYKHYYDKTITPSRFEDSVEAVVGKQMNSFFYDYLYGNKRYPLDYLEEYRDEYYEYMDKNIKLFFYDVPILYFIAIELRQKCSPYFNIDETFDSFGERPSYVDFLKNNYDINNLSEEMTIDSLNKYSGNDCSDFFELYTYKDGKLSVEKLKELLLSGKELKYGAILEPFKANLSIKSNPSGAKIIINEETKGRTPSNVKLDYGTYTIKIEKEGYEIPEERTITLQSEETKEIFFELTPMLAMLSIISKPENATIYFNGEVRGTSPLDRLELEPGEYTITIEKEGYETTEEKVNLEPGKAKTVSVVLKEIPKPAPPTTTPAPTTVAPTTSPPATTAPSQGSSSFFYIGIFVVVILIVLAAYYMGKKKK